MPVYKQPQDIVNEASVAFDLIIARHAQRAATNGKTSETPLLRAISNMLRTTPRTRMSSRDLQFCLPNESSELGDAATTRTNNTLVSEGDAWMSTGVSTVRERDTGKANSFALGTGGTAEEVDEEPDDTFGGELKSCPPSTRILSEPAITGGAALTRSEPVMWKRTLDSGLPATDDMTESEDRSELLDASLWNELLGTPTNPDTFGDHLNMVGGGRSAPATTRSISNALAAASPDSGRTKPIASHMR